MIKNLRPISAFGALLLATLACARTSTSIPPSPTDLPVSQANNPTASAAASSLPAGQVTRTLMHGGRERSYILYTPASVDWSRPVPLVFVLHGGTGNAESAIHMSGFNAIADQNGFLAVYPNGTGALSDNILLTWNGGNCCGYAQEHNVDDVGFIRVMVSELQSLADIDPTADLCDGNVQRRNPLASAGLRSRRSLCCDRAGFGNAQFFALHAVPAGFDD